MEHKKCSKPPTTKIIMFSEKIPSHRKKQKVWGPAEPPSELQRPLRVASFLWPLGVLVNVTYWVPEVVGKSHTETLGFW
jgi:hypothetical protein